MKIRIKLLVAIVFSLITSLNSYSQNFIYINRLDEDIMLYQGTLLTYWDENNDIYGYGFDQHFYKGTMDTTTEFNSVYTKKMDRSNVLYPVGESGGRTKKDSIVGRIFKVLKVYNNGYEERVLTLRDTLTNELIDYYFVPGKRFDFATLVSQQSIDENWLSKLEVVKDAFTKNIVISTPHDEYATIIMNKLNVGATKYYLSLATYSSIVTKNEKDITILFTDGTIWKRTNIVNVYFTKNPQQGSYDAFENRTLIPLTSADLSVFSTKTIDKFRLFIHDKTIENGTDLQNYAKYLKELKPGSKYWKFVTEDK
jgi:hypothetical protein